MSRETKRQTVVLSEQDIPAGYVKTSHWKGQRTQKDTDAQKLIQNSVYKGKMDYYVVFPDGKQISRPDAWVSKSDGDAMIAAAVEPAPAPVAVADPKPSPAPAALVMPEPTKVAAPAQPITGHVTTERTGKRHKLNRIYAWTMLAVSVFLFTLFCVCVDTSSNNPQPFLALVGFAGLLGCMASCVWLYIIKWQVWWHHG